MATWPSTDEGRPPESAVLLVPLALEAHGREGRALSLKRAGAPQVNLTLLHVLEAEHGCRIDPEALGKHDHLLIETGHGHTLALNDARRFGSVDLVETATLESWGPFAALGPEPLGPGLDAAHLARAFKGRIAAVKLLLLDQTIVAGLGNIYVCEALHRARIAPTREGGTISLSALRRLVAEIRAVLEEAIAAGGSTLRDYARPDGELGYFAKDWRVYGREGEPCAACPGAAAPAPPGSAASPCLKSKSRPSGNTTAGANAGCPAAGWSPDNG
jgi:DNA-formamidopyrimidine glycosylase